MGSGRRLMATANSEAAVTTEDTQESLATLWLPLLRRLTERFPEWGLWKNADAALQGHGDFDSTAPHEDWNEITDIFARWAVKNDLGPVAACRHVKGALFLVALDKSGSMLLELDIIARKYFRGWTVFQSDQLKHLMEIDKKGYRRVRPGAEGVILLTQNGLKWGGRADQGELERKRVAEFLQSDPEGVVAASELFRPADKALVRAAQSAARGEWDRAAMLFVEARAVLGALRAPSIVLSRIQAKQVKKKCPVLMSIFSDGRMVRGRTDAWIERVARQGEIYDA